MNAAAIVMIVSMSLPAEPPPFTTSKAGEAKTISGIALCWCPPGTFMMGSPPNEPERRPGEDQVQVKLTKGFWMGKYEVTQGEWKRVMGELPGKLTAELPAGDDLPVGNVNFAQTEAFCKALTELGHKSGELPKDWEFRLPTEAQWEYACRAGTTTIFSTGDKLSSTQANFLGSQPFNGAEKGPDLNKAVKVGQYPANAWGLHDMHGNTFEWCRDWYHAKLPGGTDPDLYAAKETAVKNRTGDCSRVRRGGAWTDEGKFLRAAFRLRFEPERGYDHIGFRVVAVQSTGDKPVSPPVKEPALRDEILKRTKEDQEARKASIAAMNELGAGGKISPENHAKMERVEKADRENTAWMKTVIAKHGWPTISMVGKDGAGSAWLLVQHADADVKFQRQCLDLMTQLPKEEVSVKNVAYLTDRVQLAEGKKQIYGTQFTQENGTWKPRPLEDEGNVDKRRADVGLPPIAEYAKEFEKIYGGKK